MILERTNIGVLEKKTIYIGETTMLAHSVRYVHL